ncbi:MAG: hypothetical protein JXA30_15245, partial [Deltaproteobacteria bacterium]|nr:hypothetical protein [Deltaproteobacteria bacterium]
VLAVPDEPARGRKPVLRDELAAVVVKQQYPSERLHGEGRHRLYASLNGRFQGNGNSPCYSSPSHKYLLSSLGRDDPICAFAPARNSAFMASPSRLSAGVVALPNTSGRCMRRALVCGSFGREISFNGSFAFESSRILGV